ncbi:hypothetical protein M0R45_031529 [Rubus argutus]|uniref:Uncharacterized protein n=1 Tax=Rubus argutus TaxID=59490 RepID=A0AAW1WGG8_RUBAR
MPSSKVRLHSQPAQPPSASQSSSITAASMLRLFPPPLTVRPTVWEPNHETSPPLSSGVILLGPVNPNGLGSPPSLLPPLLLSFSLRTPFFFSLHQQLHRALSLFPVPPTSPQFQLSITKPQLQLPCSSTHRRSCLAQPRLFFLPQPLSSPLIWASN